MRLENNELRTFCAVVESNGFQRAAELLHVTQSAVSQTIAGLERKLAVDLIRRGRQLELTEAGRRLYEHGTEMLNGEHSVLTDIARIKTGGAASLSLALSGTINRFFAPQLLSLYLKRWPDTQLTISEMPARSIVATVLSGHRELGFGPLQKQMSAFDTFPLYEEARHLVVAKSHPEFAELTAGDAKALRKTALITSALDDSDLRPSMQRIRDHFGTVWEVSSLSLRIQLIDQGRGLGYVSEKLLREHPVARDFEVVGELPFGSIDRSVGLYYRSGHRLSPAAQRFRELCVGFWSENA